MSGRRDLAALLTSGLAHHQRGELNAAEALYQACLRAAPRHYDALHLLGLLYLQTHRAEQSLTLLEQARGVNPGDPNGHVHLAQARLAKLDAPGAIAAADEALRLDPRLAEAWFTKGNAQQNLKQFAAAIDSYGRNLALDPRSPEALSNCANALRMLRRYPEALEHSNRAIALRPDYARALNNRGLIAFETDRFDASVADFKTALTLDPGLVEAMRNLATVLMRLKLHAEAAVQFERILALRPDFPFVRGLLLYARSQDFDWRDRREMVDAIRRGTLRGLPMDAPMSFLNAVGSAEEQQLCAATFVRSEFPMRAGAMRSAQAIDTAAERRIRVAYLSGDFGEHAVSYLLAGVWEAHDRAAFETIAISWGRQAPTETRTRAMAAFERFIDVSSMSDAAVEALLRDLQVDIAVDLSGYTAGHRTAVLAGRPAPVQVNFLGFPGTMGAPYLDFLIADRFVVPPERVANYAERILWMPETFQPTDDRRALPQSGPGRARFGLSDASLVLCSFNEPSKLNPETFDAWAAILAAVPDAVLWILANSEAAQANLRREFSVRELDVDRLIFAERLPYTQHLWRYRLADLFLDSAPFSGGATASDAVSMGLPVLTIAGDSFASRMAASILALLGLPQLVTDDLNDYRLRAIALAGDRAQLAALRQQLGTARSGHPYFQTQRYCRHLEAAFRAMRADVGSDADTRRPLLCAARD